MPDFLKTSSKRLVLFLTVLVLLSPLLLEGQNPEAQRLTLVEAESKALEDNPRLEAARFNTEFSQAGLARARSKRLRRLTFNETYTHSNNPVFVFGSLLEQSRFGASNFALDSLNSPGSLSNFRSSVQFEIPIFNRFGVSGEIETARIRNAEAETMKELVTQQIRYQVIEAYYGVLVAQERKLVAEEAVTTAQSELLRIRDFYSQGMVVASDLLAMEVQLAEFQQQLAQTEAAVNVSYAALSAVLGERIDRDVHLVDEPTDRSFPTLSLETMAQQALHTRPDYLHAQLEVSRLREGVRTANGQFLPDLNLFADYGQSGRDLRSGSGDFALGARLTFNILDFERGPRIDQAHAARQSAEAERRAKADQVRLEVIRAYEGLQASRQQLLFARSAVSQAEEAFRIIRNRYEVGLATITEILRSQTALMRARLNLLIARYDYYVGYGQTLLASGTLVDVSAFVQ